MWEESGIDSRLTEQENALPRQIRIWVQHADENIPDPAVNEPLGAGNLGMMAGSARLDDRVDRGPGQGRVSQLSFEENVFGMLSGSRLAAESRSQDGPPRGRHGRNHRMPAAVL